VSGGDRTPQLVRSRVRFVRRGLASVRLVEGVALSLAALTTALAAAVTSGTDLGASGAWWAAGLCALLVGATWGVEHHLSDTEVASRVDRGLGLHGALFTAWEAEGGREVTAIGRLLCRSVVERTSVRRMLKAVLPVSAPLLALPFAGATLLFLALDEVRSRPAGADLGALSARLGDQLSDLAQANSGAPPPGSEGLTSRELSEVARVAREAQALAARGGDDREELAELAERITALEESLPMNSEIRKRLERAEETLDSALMALEEPPSSSRGEAGSESDEGAGPGRGSDGPGSTLASGDTSVRMKDPIPSDFAEGRPSERGVLSGPGWSEAHDRIVARWIAASRSEDHPR
jgi:hypothetical protein